MQNDTKFLIVFSPAGSKHTSLFISGDNRFQGKLKSLNNKLVHVVIVAVSTKKLINSQSKKEIENFIQAILRTITWQTGFQKALSTALKEMKEEASRCVILKKREHAIKHTSQ